MRCQDDFVDNARLLVFEAYCRIHQCIDLRMLAAKLNMDESAAEKWVVNLIRNADLNAKINSQVSDVFVLVTFHVQSRECSCLGY